VERADRAPLDAPGAVGAFKLNEMKSSAEKKMNTRASAACGITAGIALVLVRFPGGAALDETKRPGTIFTGMQVGYSPDSIGELTRYGCFGEEQRADWFLRHAVSRRTNEHPLAIVAGVEFDIPWFR